MAGWLRLTAGFGIVAALGCADPGHSDTGTDGAAAAPGDRSGSTLQAVRSRGVVKCGIAQAAGFATPDDAGRWRGFDVDFCRAIAVALFDDAEKVELVPFTMQQRFSGLQAREVDLLVNGTSVTSSRALGMGFHFGPVYLYDGQAFMVPAASHVANARQLDGASVCVRQGTTSELNLADFARRSGIRVRPIVFDDLRAMVSAVGSTRCDAVTQDLAGLATTRNMLPDPAAYRILPEWISKEPIAAVLRSGDDQWLTLVNWVFWATMQAEEFGLTRANVAGHRDASEPTLRRFLGMEAGVTDGLGLDPRWTFRVIAAVGNYGEIFERNIGEATPLGMPRGQNRLWTDGGLLFAPPFR